MTVEPLASTDAILARLPAGTFDNMGQLEAALRDASAAVRDAAGQQFTVSTSTLQRVKIRNGIIRLSQRPVTAVSAVKDDNDNDVSYTWLGDDRVRLRAYGDALNAWELEPYRTSLGEVRVTYTHGYAETDMPDLVVAIVCNVALRALGRDPGDGSIMQESIEGYSYQIGATGAAGPVGLLPEEKLRLESFLRPHAASWQ